MDLPSRKADTEGLNGSLRRDEMIGLQDGRRVNIRPAKQLWLPFEIKGGLFTTKAGTSNPVENEQLMEKVVSREDLYHLSWRT